MKIRIQSDLHFEFLNDESLHQFIEKQIYYQKINNADILILAGDICTFNTTHYLITYLIQISPLYKYVLYVLGNHEYYHGKSIDVEEKFKNICSKFDNVKLLLNEEFIYDNIYFFGSTLWTPIDKLAYKQMNDKRFLSYEEIIAKHKICKEKCIEFLKRDEYKILITHHLPCKVFINEIYKGSEINSGFSADCDEFFHYDIKYWIYGHTHMPLIKEYKGCKTICVPYGYPGENKNDFYDNFFEI